LAFVIPSCLERSSILCPPPPCAGHTVTCAEPLTMGLDTARLHKRMTLPKSGLGSLSTPQWTCHNKKKLSQKASIPDPGVDGNQSPTDLWPDIEMGMHPMNGGAPGPRHVQILFLISHVCLDASGSKKRGSPSGGSAAARDADLPPSGVMAPKRAIEGLKPRPYQGFPAGIGGV